MPHTPRDVPLSSLSPPLSLPLFLSLCLSLSITLSLYDYRYAGSLSPYFLAPVGRTIPVSNPRGMPEQ